MTETIVLIGLGFFIFQQVFWMWQIQKLVDKCMSGSFAEYKQSINIDKQNAPKEYKLKTDNEPIEDMSVLGFN